MKGPAIADSFIVIETILDGYAVKGTALTFFSVPERLSSHA